MDDEIQFICTNCGASMKKLRDSNNLFYVCPKCGCYQEGYKKDFYNGSACPNCHHILENEVECGYCGYYLGSDFE